MFQKKWFVFIGFLLIFNIYGGDISILLERVRYCKHSTCLTGGTTPYKFRFWEDNNVGDGDQRKTYITTLSEPSKASVKNIAVFFAGQQGADFGNNDGVQNVVTGQPEGVKDGCKFDTKSCWRTANEDSLAIKIKNSGIFNMSNTFFAMVYDTAFYYGTLSGNKQDIEDAYYSWLRDKVEFSNLQVVYLGGSSRGGCLSLRLAKRFKADFPNGNVKVIVTGVDPVCNKSQGEMGATSTSHQNPYTDDNDYHTWNSDFNSQFPNKHGLYIYNVLGGERVVALSSSHSISYGGDELKDIGWYRHHWVAEEHKTMGRNYETTLNDGNTRIIDALVAFAKEKILEQEFVSGDFNGDGKDEVIKVSHFMEMRKFNNGVWSTIWENNGNQSFGISPYRKMIAGDFDGDGKDEIFAYGGWTTLFKYNNGQWQWIWSNYGSTSGISAYTKFLAGDFNGDGKDEIFAYSDGTWKTMFYYQNNSWVWGWSNYGNTSEGITPYTKFVAGDFDQDGKDEIFAYSDGTWKTMFHYENNGWVWGWSNYGNTSQGITPYNKFVAGDFDGDGRDDLMAIAGWTTMFRFENSNWVWSWSNYGNTSQPITPYKYMISANVDSDSGDELICLYGENNYVMEYENSSWVNYTPESSNPNPIDIRKELNKVEMIR